MLTVETIGKLQLAKGEQPVALWRAKGKVRNKFPRWFLAAMKKIGKADIFRGGAYMLHGCGWLDHGGKFKTEAGVEGVVSEPYYLSLEDLEEIAKLCKEGNLWVRIDGCTQHYPTRTLSIRFYQKDGEICDK